MATGSVHAVVARSILVVNATFAVVLGVPAPICATTTDSAPTVAESYGKLPLIFEENLGQTGPEVRFLSRGSRYTLFLTRTEVILRLRGAKVRRERTLGDDPHGSKVEAPTAVLSMSLTGARSVPEVSGVGRLPGRSHYFIGNDPAAYRSDVAQYERVRYRSVYPGIDVEYYGNQRQLEYNFVVNPGADPGSIRLRFGGFEDLCLDDAGNLIVETVAGKVIERVPVAYQVTGGRRHSLEARFVQHEDGEVGVEVGEYDRHAQLVIDPVLDYSTYLGGSDDDELNAIAVDSVGSAYVCGSTQSADFPVVGPIQGDSGSTDAFVAKLSEDGSSLVYSTYLGGYWGDYCFAIAVDFVGNAYVAGLTTSEDFPTVNPIQASPGSSYSDAFVAKLGADGSALVFSTYLGGYYDDYCTGLALGGSGSAYVTGYTTSADFPTVNAIQDGLAGMNDAFVAKLNSAGTALLYSTYLGGGGYDDAWAIAVDSAGSAYVTGDTDSSDFPTVSPLQGAHAGGQYDAFVTKLNAAGSAFAFSTYLGGSANDRGYGVVTDSTGSAYVAGSTSSTDFPTVGTVREGLQIGEGHGLQ